MTETNTKQTVVARKHAETRTKTETLISIKCIQKTNEFVRYEQ